MTKKLRRKFEYLESIKSFYYETKSIFHQFQRTFLVANKTIFFEKGESNFKVCIKILRKSGFGYVVKQRKRDVPTSKLEEL